MNTTPHHAEFSDTEQALLAPFVTDMTSPIFGLRNLPEVVKGALFSRYSRSDKSIRRILLDEFINLPESGFTQLVAQLGTESREQLVATQQAEAFYDRVLVGYGDDSVAELGGAHVACEDISNVAAKIIEDARIGLSPLEKSTRYVTFNKKVNGQYRYVREASIMQSRWATCLIPTTPSSNPPLPGCAVAPNVTHRPVNAPITRQHAQRPVMCCAACSPWPPAQMSVYSATDVRLST